MKKRAAVLVLNDGTVFRGRAFGAEGITDGEVVFNTGMTGYQEIITDPSYAGQIVVMTYPLIGNYGINNEDSEAGKPSLRGLIVKEAARAYSNWRAVESLDDFLKRFNIIGLQGIDTRALTRKIRERGARPGLIAAGDFALDELRKRAAGLKGMVGRDLVKEVTAAEEYSQGAGNKGPRIIAMDFGIKSNILRLMAEQGFKIKVVPATTSAGEILKNNPEGVFLSNGPGDPEAVFYAAKEIKKLLGKVPIFGICLGHQLLALAAGAEIYKLKFGHHGCNHPVKNLINGRVEITSQNHGFAVKSETLPSNAELTHINLNDQSVEGLNYKSAAAFSVQYHPEAAPGPHDSRYLFADFHKLINNFRRRANVH